MNITGIIAEYDPFHNGHLYHINQAKKFTSADAVVVVMSGEFMQRGTPSFIDKMQRAQMAVENGADLVIELPYMHACSSSQEFARGAVRILDSLGCVNNLAFGSETSDLKSLKDAAEAVLDRDKILISDIKSNLKKGMSYPSALTAAVESHYGEKYAKILKSPNNLLAAEYIKSLINENSDIKPFGITRTSAAHNETQVSVNAEMSASATAIRNLLAAGKISEASGYLPDATLKIINRNDYTDIIEKRKRRMFDLLRYRLLTAHPEELEKIYTVSEGLENRMLSAIADTASWDEFLEAVKSRRYTQARLSRMLIHVLMNFRQKDFLQLRDTIYAKVLGFSEKGSVLLKNIRKTENLTIVSNLSRLNQYDEKVRRCLELGIRAADLYSIICDGADSPEAVRLNTERRNVPYRTKV